MATSSSSSTMLAAQRALHNMTASIVKFLIGRRRKEEDALALVWGWDGVGRSAVLDHVAAALTDAAKEDSGLRVVSLHILEEEKYYLDQKINEALSATMGFRFSPDPPTRTYEYGKSSALRQSYFVVIAHTKFPLHEYLEEFFPYRGIWCTFIVLQHEPPSRQEDHVTTRHRRFLDFLTFNRAVLAGHQFDDLTEEAALGLLQLEARSAAANAVSRFQLHRGGGSCLPVVNEETALHCFLYCTLVPELRGDPASFWRAEGLLGDHGFDHSAAAAELVQNLIAEFEERKMLEWRKWVEELSVAVPIVSKAREAYQRVEGQRGRALMLKPSSDLAEFPSMTPQEWRSSDISRISLACNSIHTLPPSLHLPECCPNLCTLLLNDNHKLAHIPDGVFSPHMPHLRVIDLSRTAISKLPSSLSCCGNLRALFLNNCSSLQALPSSIETAFERLQVLSLSNTPLPNMTKLSLHHKPDLKTLYFSNSFVNLEEFNLSVNNGRVFEYYPVRELNEDDWAAPIKRAHVSISHAEEMDEEDRSSRLMRNKFPHYAIVRDQIQLHIHSTLTSGNAEQTECTRHLVVQGGEEDVIGYKIAHTICQPDFISLCDHQADVLIQLDVFRNLRSCRIQRCHQMREAFLVNETGSTLENIFLSSMERLTYMAFCPSTVSLAHLRNIRIECCQNLIALFRGSLAQLPVLKELEIKFCARLQSIFDKELEEKVYGESHLPALERLCLWELPELTSICNGCLPSVQTLKVRGCWKLLKLPTRRQV